jgi:hypothetical protein
MKNTSKKKFSSSKTGFMTLRAMGFMYLKIFCIAIVVKNRAKLIIFDEISDVPQSI